MNSPDLEALVTSKISEAILAAIEQIGQKEFFAIAGIEDDSLQELLKGEGRYVSVALVTLACQINRSHGDPNIKHSSITECLKGTTIRMPQTVVQPALGGGPHFKPRRALRRLPMSARSAGPFYEKKSLRVLGFSANTIAFFLLGYFLGGIGLSPLLGQPSCTGLSFSPLSLVPCTGSFIGTVLGALGGLGYTYYYFVKKM